ncbi:hypothetical protein [Effusibacillus pohliae]|uniref:hypothetical protein n=1 Tax=Effusibacillus pohliae TaxID=232270 RepID=UPI000380C0DE|nr:hypothetical protein [Effusibacillus pohliae]
MEQILQQILAKLDHMETEMKQMKADMVTKQDLERFATKQDLEKFATKQDLEKFATKQDLEKFATKQDLAAVHRKLDTIYEQVARNTEQSAQIAELFTRMDKVETDVRLIKKLIAAE